MPAPNPPRPGSKRARIVRLMSRPEGATTAALRRATGWDAKTLYDGLRLVRVANGYRIVEKDDTLFIRAGMRRRKAPPAPAAVPD